VLPKTSRRHLNELAALHAPPTTSGAPARCWGATASAPRLLAATRPAHKQSKHLLALHHDNSLRRKDLCENFIILISVVISAPATPSLRQQLDAASLPRGRRVGTCRMHKRARTPSLSRGCYARLIQPAQKLCDTDPKGNPLIERIEL
ncbi:jg16570, partial [Pararge aegeria aegeria]